MEEVHPIEVGDLVYLEGRATSLKDNELFLRRFGYVIEDHGDSVLVKWIRGKKEPQARTKRILHRAVATFVGLVSVEDGRRAGWIRK